MPADREWVTLEDYVESLLREGKRSQHDEFKALFTVYGKEHVTEIAQQILKKWKERKDKDELA